jgi:Response regulator containing CheY-like receiver, AAA-type ATPase, and DNA-binding domains
VSPSKPQILVVDDDPDLLKLLTMRLQAAGYAVASAASGEAALAQVAAVKPSLVITDLRMGSMDGLTLFDALHKSSPALHRARLHPGCHRGHTAGRIRLSHQAIRQQGIAAPGRSGNRTGRRCDTQ